MRGRVPAAAAAVMLFTLAGAYGVAAQGSAAHAGVRRTAAPKKLFSPRDRVIRQRIDDAVSIVDRDQYDKVPANPFLASALFYSEHAIAAIRESRSGPARIVGAIYPHITKEFREGYLKWLDQAAAAGSEPGGSARLSLPVAKFSYVWKMDRGHHDAIDLVAAEGTPVMSMSRGIVVLAENGWRAADDLSTSSEMGGNTVIVYDPAGQTFFRYAHLSKSTVKAGEVVSAGQPIGTVGHTGKQAMRRGHGKHVHLEMNRWDPETGAITVMRATELKEILESLK